MRLVGWLPASPPARYYGGFASAAAAAAVCFAWLVCSVRLLILLVGRLCGTWPSLCWWGREPVVVWVGSLVRRRVNDRVRAVPACRQHVRLKEKPTF